MQVDTKIIEEARGLLSQEDVVLPYQLHTAPSFWLAQSEDDQVIAFSAFEFAGKKYKIGALKQA